MLHRTCHGSFWLRTLSLLILLLLVGCGDGKSRLRGSVVVDGVPANCGMVIAADDAERGGRGAIRLDGSFTIENLDPGTVRVWVQKGTPPMDADHKYIPPVVIPDRYTAPTSGLTLLLKPGTNDARLELTTKLP